MLCFRCVPPRKAGDGLERSVLHVPVFTLMLIELVELGSSRRKVPLANRRHDLPEVSHGYQ